ncbi:MAG TPA: transporter substrate-binding domain-containing protein [Candidatus Ventricola intestinavium]|nr:transporter substrate-binding domain-containing protein [Candidatus Ventricola intestinavium]
MKRIAAGMLALLLALAAAAGVCETLKVGMECNYAPYNWTQSGESEEAVAIAAGGYADGYDVRIAKIIAQELGRELEIVKTEWDGLAPALMSGKIDCIIAGMSPTEERKVTIDFTDPYYTTELCVVVRKDSAYAGAQSLADFAGAKITGQLNTFHYNVIDQIPDVSKQPAMETFPAMMVAVTAGAIDGYIADRPGAVSAITSNPELTYVSFEEGNGFEISADDSQIAVGVQKGSELAGQINAILAEITEEERNAIMDAVVAAQPLSE